MLQWNNQVTEDLQLQMQLLNNQGHLQAEHKVFNKKYSYDSQETGSSYRIEIDFKESVHRKLGSFTRVAFET